LAEAENVDRSIIVPVVDDVLQDVEVARLRYGLEEVTGDELDSACRLGGQTSLRSLDDDACSNKVA
jgi:hypothetical protein